LVEHLGFSNVEDSGMCVDVHGVIALVVLGFKKLRFRAGIIANIKTIILHKNSAFLELLHENREIETCKEPQEKFA